MSAALIRPLAALLIGLLMAGALTVVPSEQLGASVLEGRVSPKPKPKVVLPDTTDDQELVKLLFRNLNNAYKTGDTTYLNHFFLGDEATGVTGQATDGAEYFVKDIAYAAEYRRVTGDKSYTNRNRARYLGSGLIDDPDGRKILLSWVSVERSIETNRSSDPRFLIIFIEERPSSGEDLIAYIRELDEGQATAATGKPDVISSYSRL